MAEKSTGNNCKVKKEKIIKEEEEEEEEEEGEITYDYK
jgi:hypothetical protein